jgi:2-keto-4-pentenoate hydratase/2-oxohepta-3-ene-1,7-dioic acid hydratase in catechol pathway
MQLAHLAGREAPLAVVQDGRVAPLADRVGIATVDELIASGADVAEAAAQALAEAQPLQPGMLARPLLAPGNIACVGLNYEDHIRETGLDRPERPLIFAKFTSSLLGPDEEIRWPAGLTTQVDWEAELAVVIGVRGKNIDPERAGFHVAAYSVCNDITARGYHRRDAVPADAFRYDWFAAKSVEGSLPLGPGLTPAFLVPDPQDLRLRLWVNGELQQDESTADMVCPVAELIAAASEVVTLEPGDVIATGTPAGVGAARGLYLRGGDVVRVTIDGLGTLENTVKED